MHFKNMAGLNSMQSAAVVRRLKHINSDAQNGFILTSSRHEKPFVFFTLDELLEFQVEDTKAYFKVKFQEEIDREAKKTEVEETGPYVFDSSDDSQKESVKEETDVEPVRKL